MQISLAGLRPKFLSDLIRMGAAGDGGYVVNKTAIEHSQYLLSFGVNDNWSFEIDFLNRDPGVRVGCFDHSVSKAVFLKKAILSGVRVILRTFSFNFAAAQQQVSRLTERLQLYANFSNLVRKQNVMFFRKGISDETTGYFISFSEAFRLVAPSGSAENSVFVKMDIEGYEFRVIPDLLIFQRYINSLVVEFHDLDLHWEEFVELIGKIKVIFEITHIHGNNYAGLIPHSSTPKVLEITFLKKSLISQGHLACEPVAYPISELDYPNNKFERDYPLAF